MADWDFSIENMDFRLAINDQTPYERATAPFRKDQIDTSATPGDNSLTGWWARGQYSFHEGSGIKYYDIDGSQDVLNRFQDSTGLDPWTPGELSYMEGHETRVVPSGAIDFTFSDWGGCGFAVAGSEVYRCNPSAAEQITLATEPGAAHCVVAVATSAYLGNGSVIEKIDDAYRDTTTTVLWTNNNLGTTDDRFHRIWFAKNRLWAVTIGGQWFALPLTGGTIPAGGGAYLVWDSGITSSQTKWGFADTPGAVYISDRQRIYALQTDYQGDVSSGLVPTVQVDLGVGRVIYGIGYCRGILGIAESNEFLVGSIDSSGAVTVGPGIIKYASTTCRAISTWEDRLFFTATSDDGVERLYEVNISTGQEPLQPGWQIRDTVPFTGGVHSFTWCVSGANTFGELTRVAVASDASTTAIHYLSDKSLTPAAAPIPPVAYVTTGFHRFGTLDDKNFYSIEVSMRRPGYGQIVVERVDLDGTLTSVGTVSQDGKTSLPINVDAEAMAFKFTIQGGMRPNTPVLLGYQLKALPVPKRQRILKVPLLIQDVIRLRGGAAKGRRGKAWTDLQALEALESSQAIVSFTDHRTGETGQAYIDMVDFQCDTPAVRDNNGFGGTAYIQLRVIGS